MSLSLSWKLIRRCTSATSAKASSIARCACVSPRPSTRMETVVPRSGRARSILGDDDRIGSKQPLDAVGDVAAGKCGAGNVLDILGERQRRAVPFAGELAAPGRIAHLIAIGLAIFEDLHRFDGALRIKPERDGDIFMLANDLIGDEPAACRHAPQTKLAIMHRDAGSLLDRLHLFL